MLRVLGTLIILGLIEATAIAQSSRSPVTCWLFDGSGNALSSTAGALNVSGGGGGGGGSNAAAGLTGAAVPTSAGYTGFNSGGNLIGVSSSNPLPVAQQGSISVGNFPATQACTQSGTWSGVGVTGPLTDAQLRASPVGITVDGAKITAATMPAGGSGAIGWLSAIWDRVSAMATSLAGTLTVSGSVSVSNFPATQPVSGTVAATQSGTWNIGSITTLPALTNQAAASNNPIGTVSLGNSLGKTNIGKPGTLATSAATADQVVVTYTVTAGKTFYLSWFACNARLTTFAATATLFGTCSLESPAGTKLLTTIIAGPGIGDRDYLPLPEPIPIAAGVVVRIVTTPAAATAMTWQGNMGGYEK